MAYVTVPKDLTRVKSKVVLGLTKRQLICFGGALLVGVPLFLLIRGRVPTSAAALIMVFAMLPGFLLALYERHGQPLEVVVWQIILIDRANEDKETSVHFLNQVDDADLQALLEDGEAEPEVCTCAEKCEAGAVNTACPVCKNNLTACVGAAPEAEEPAETAEPEDEAGNSMGGLIVFLVVLLIGGGAALYFFKFKKPKASTKGNDDLDEYDFGEDEDDEDDEDEPTPEVDDGTGEVEARPLDDYLLDEDEQKKEDE